MKKLVQVLSIAMLFVLTFRANAQTTYTYTGGDLNNVTSWSPNPPAIPSGSADTWLITTSASIPYGDDWIITAGSSVVLGDGTTAMSLIAGGYIYSDDYGQDLNLTVKNNVTFYVLPDDMWGYSFNQSTVVFATGSTVIYSYDAADYGAGGTAIVCPGDYYNITITQDASLYYGDITVENTLSNSAVLYMQSSGVTLKNTVTGTGSFAGTSGATLDIESSGSVGTLDFTSGYQVLKKLKIGSGSATLNTDLLISNVGAGGTTISTFDQSGGSLSLNGHTLTLDKDNVTKFGTSSNVITGGGSSTLIINSKTLSSGSLYMDQTSSTTNALKCLILNGGNTNLLTIANPLNITDSITITKGFLGVTNPGDLTLIADQTTAGKTARMGTFAGNLITGTKITSQVFHNPPGNQTNWMLMGAPGTTGSTFNDWNNNFSITCPTCPYSTVSGTTFNSVQSYNETSGTTFGDTLHYSPIGGLSSTINSGQGYWVYLGTANPGVSIPGQLISIVGTPKVGNININLTNSNTSDLTNYGYNLISNPYPSPISWKKVMTLNSLTGGSNQENNVYAYSASYNGGDYVVYNASTGISVPSSGSYTIGDNIPIGFGFYVQTAVNNRTLTFNEHVKISDPTYQILFRESANQQPNSTQSTVNTSQTHYFNLQVTGNGNESWAAIAFNANASDTTDGYDARALAYNNLLQISSSSTAAKNKDYAINCMPDLTQNYSIPVKILSGTTGQYLITPTNLQDMLLGACLNLHDNYTGTDYNIRNGAFSVTINDTETVARFVLQVTVSQLPITANAIQASCANKADGLITVKGNNAGPWDYIWKDANGAVVKTSLNKASADSLTNLNSGVFTVEVNTVGSCDAAVQTFTFTSPVLESVFAAPTQVTAGTAVTFTNTSTNATNYTWQFGDGNTASQQTPSYTYNNAGTYSVTLYAINTACNDTSVSTQVVEVSAAVTTGIKSIAGNDNIFLSRDVTGNYLQFNYTTQTKVNITVYNVLGQTLLNNAGLNVVNDKIYLNINDSKNQVLYVTVTDLNSNTQTTKKFVNN
jgi:PKD repeat protein